MRILIKAVPGGFYHRALFFSCLRLLYLSCIVFCTKNDKMCDMTAVFCEKRDNFAHAKEK